MEVVSLGAVNGDNRLPGEQFGLRTEGWYSTNAPGSRGITASQDSPALASVPVTDNPYASGQLPRPSVTVGVGDTSAYSSDNPVPANVLLPDAAGAGTTGAGTGSSRDHHPNATV